MAIEIPRRLHDRMVEHARAEAPNEACGVLAGVEGKAVEIFPMTNAEESPTIYRFDEREQLRVFDEVERSGWALLAFFHSHTHTEAYPSPTDIRDAHWNDPVSGAATPAYPGTRYVIVSLAHGSPDVRSFTFEGGEPVEEEVRIT